MAEEPSTRRTRSIHRGPRSERVVASVVRATRAELARHGYSGFVVDRVIESAKVSRATLYRRWPTKIALIRAVLEDMVAKFDLPVDTGSLRADLDRLTRQLFGNMEGSGRGFSRMIQSERYNRELASVVGPARRLAHDRFAAAFERARQRGEIAKEANTALLGEILFETFIAKALEPKADKERLASELIELFVGPLAR